MVKRTPWFNSLDRQNPVRQGVYERRCNDYGPIYYSRWNGRKWMSNFLACDGNIALIDASRSIYPSANQFMQWRGLVKEPK